MNVLKEKKVNAFKLIDYPLTFCCFEGADDKKSSKSLKSIVFQRVNGLSVFDLAI